MEALSRAVVQQLAGMRRTNENRPSLYNFKGKQWKPDPSTAIFDFLNYKLTSQWNLESSDVDGGLVNLFWVWNDCGVFSGKRQVDWKQVRVHVDESFCVRAQAKLSAALGPENTVLLRLCLCRSLDECRQALVELKGGRDRVQINKLGTEVLFSWAVAYVQMYSNNQEDLCIVWKTMYETLKDVAFMSSDPRNESRFRSQFVANVVSLSSYRNSKSIQMYFPLIEVAYPGHRDYDIWIGTIRKSICGDVSPNIPSIHLPSMEDVTVLISSDAFKTIRNSSTFDAITSYSKRVMDQHGRIYEKLVFLGMLHEMFVSVPWQQRSDHEKKLLELFRLAVQREGERITVIEACMRTAEKRPDIFDGHPVLIQGITDVALPVDDGKWIVSDPLCLSESLSVVSLGRAGPLLSTLLKRLSENVFKNFKSIIDAVGFYTSATSSQAAPSKLKEIATLLFSRMFQTWCPESFPDLALESSKTLRSVFECFASCSHPSVINDQLSSIIKNCENHVRTLIRNWRRDFDSNKISGIVLGKVLRYCLTRSWEIIADFSSTELPTEEEIHSKISEFETGLDSIARSISCHGGSNSSIQDVLKGYNCQFDSSTELGRIFNTYDFLLVGEGGSSPRKSFAELSMDLCDVTGDARYAKDFHAKHHVMIRLCEYFLKNSSVLFRNAISVSIEHKVEVGILADAVFRAKEAIRSLFTPDTAFEIVDKAANDIIEAGSSPKQELSILLGSTDFELTYGMVERFELVSSITCFEAPLHGFVNFCEQVQFAFVEHDPIFIGLKLVIEQFSEREEAPEKMLNRLRELLCPDLSDVTSFETIREELHHRLPVLRFSSYLSSSIEIWRLARDMEWIDRDGLKRFHDEYANVTNVLLGNTETYEMAVLDSLGITIPAVALLGSFVDSLTVKEFFDGVQNNENIRSNVDGNFKDLRQVQSNISSIRDWFTNGVDEVSKVYSVLEAIESTGEYFIVEKTEELVTEYPHELKLCYDIERNGETSIMRGKDLSNFIQNVGLSQREVGAFIEQYRVLSKASALLLEASAAGYKDANLESFRCTAGGHSLTEARDLLAQAEATARNFDSWLRSTRNSYPTALLFWTEELRELHRHFLNMDSEDDQSVDFIRPVTSRLCSCSVNETDWQLALSSVLNCFKHDDDFKCEGWLVGISRFVEKLHDAVGKPVSTRFSKNQVGEIVLHTIECDAKLKNLATEVLLQHIYKSRLPEEYEVLDCAGNHITTEKLSIFLGRSLAFPGSTFVVLHADDLEGRLMEKLLWFFSSPETAAAGIRFHCVQGRSSILHTAPWVEGKTWDEKSLNINSVITEVDQHSWRKLVADRGIDLSIVGCEKNGGGKSRHVMDRMKLIKDQDANVCFGSITLHEGSTIHSLTKCLVSSFPPGVRRHVVHFSFMYMPEPHAGSSRWLRDINHFFFSILVLGCVHDTSSPRSFHLGNDAWQIFVELPSEGVGVATEWLWQHVPVLAYCGTVHEPTRIFSIDDITRRVCIYLRAYDNGTIDRKFNSAPVSKRIMFVLDASSSMRAVVGSGKSAWDAAKENGIAIFDSHIQPGDVSTY